MSIRFKISILNIFLCLNIFAQSPSIPAEKPKLIVIAVIDQMRYDFLYRYQDKFTDGGFKRLINKGTVCKNAHHQYLLTQQLPGYVTIMSGTEPSAHGIISDQWISRVNNKIIRAGIDSEVTPINSNGKDLNCSPKNLRTSFFTDELSLSNNHKSKIISIALNGRVAALSGGYSANLALWFDHTKGNWTTSTYYADSLPTWVNNFNNKKFSDIYLDRKWVPLKPDVDTATSQNKSFNLKNFVHDLISIKRITSNYREIKQTPFGNTLTKDFAISAIIDDTLGKGSNTDVLVVGFNATGNINKKYGPLSKEMEDTYIRLDKDLEHFLTFLDNEIGKNQYLFVLTADRGTGFSPEYLEKLNIPSGEFNYKKILAVLRSYLNVVYGKNNWIKSYNSKQIYLDHQLIDDSKIDLFDMQERISRFLVQFTGVSDAMPSYILQRSSFNSGINYLMQNSYFRQRSGDILINLEPGWIEKSDSKVLQNSGYNYDAHIPLIWYGWKVPHLNIYRPIGSNDIAVTISELLEIAPPNGSDGKIIREIIER